MTFRIHQVVECPKDPKNWYQTMTIKPRGLNENLTIDLEIICDCPCEKPEHPVHITTQKDPLIVQDTRYNTIIQKKSNLCSFFFSLSLNIPNLIQFKNV